MGNPLYISILWHMHQPCYKDMRQDQYILPWVRLHGIKSYYDMGQIIAEIDGAKANFNFVPSLLVQLMDYASGQGNDVYLSHTRKDPSEMTYGEKIFLLQNFFHTNFDNLIKPYSRYLNLWEKRDGYDSWERKLSHFNHQDLFDLQVWFNLTWFGAIPKDRDPEIKELINKGRDYSAEDKELVINKQQQIIGEIIPLYKQLQDKGTIELSTTPFYHPILPLLCDTQVARDSQPDVSLPNRQFAFPSDADRQIKDAIEYHRQIFGVKPAGMWPSEGSISTAALKLMADNQIVWTASDEEILGKTLYHQGFTDWENREWLYQPYSMDLTKSSMNMFFRDHHLSDLIGFVYHRWHHTDAVGDLIHRLIQIKEQLPIDQPYLVSIILDGENAWEYYPNNGYDFLTGMYEELVRHPDLELVTFSEYLNQYGARRKLSSIYPGSWIGGNFATWIGQEPKNRAWDYLAYVRTDLERLQTQSQTSVENQELAWRSMLMAEGSDWFWWFGDTHSSALDAEFDQIFRRHLINVYQCYNWQPPAFLERPVAEIGVVDAVIRPVGYIWPVIDGLETSNQEWLAAGSMELTKGSTTMQRATYIFEKLWFGFNDEKIYLRLDGPGCQWLKRTNLELDDTLGQEPHVVFQISHQTCYLIEISSLTRLSGEHSNLKVQIDRTNNRGEEPLPSIKEFALDQILELAVSRTDLGLGKADEFELKVMVSNERGELEKWPVHSPLKITIPTVNSPNKSTLSAGGQHWHE